MEVINAIGRRKAAVARVFLSKGTGKITVNGREMKEYFTTDPIRYVINQPFTITESIEKYDIMATVVGGGFRGQAEAIRLGISRALVVLDANNKPALRKEGLMTRDPREVERKKFGRAGARKRFQFSKR
jgi:small subunit ribosomal protein S9